MEKNNLYLLNAHLNVLPARRALQPWPARGSAGIIRRESGRTDVMLPSDWSDSSTPPRSLYRFRTDEVSLLERSWTYLKMQNALKIIIKIVWQMQHHKLPEVSVLQHRGWKDNVKCLLL